MKNINKRLTRHAQGALEQAKKISRRKSLENIDASFLLKVLMQQQGSLGKSLIESFKITKEKIEKTLKRNISPDVSIHDVLVKSFQLAASTKSPFVGTEHLVYALLSIPAMAKKYLSPKQGDKFMAEGFPNGDKGAFPFSDFFSEMNMLIDNFFTPNGVDKGKKVLSIQNYTTNLNNTVSEKDHVLVGREKELERISNILGRKMKNNPVLIGDPGVGKTAIIEGLALMLSRGKSPFYLNSKKIFSLDLGLLIAGTTFRGEFEARLKEIISGAKKDKNIILFIDEIHNLIGAGNAIGGMDAANILKPALSRGEIQVIGATTFEEYQKHIEKDAALERRFQPVYVSEPSLDQTVEILRGIKPVYEEFHNLEITPESLTKAATLATRYMTDRFLPDSAIDLVDETAARIRSKSANVNLHQEIRTKENELNMVVKEKEFLVMSDRYEEAIALRDKEKILEKDLHELKNKQRLFEDLNPIKLHPKDIEETLSQITNIPLSNINGQNKEISENISNMLTNNLIGQNEVVKKINNSALRHLSGITSPNRPLGSFLFIGPTGVGKTLTAKLLAKAISPSGKDSLIHINMSEFMEHHNVSRLLGAPAGYIGYDDTGELTEKIKRNPYSVVLFDEIEKADPSVLNILLQILEEGEIVDAKGRIVNFKNTIVILTSNIGTSQLDSISQLGFEVAKQEVEEKKKDIEKTIFKELENYLLPELTNRLDEILIFNPLGKKEIEKIAEIELDKIKTRLVEKNIILSITNPAKRFIAEKSLNEAQGARFVRKFVEQEIEPLLAEKIIKGKNIKKLTLSVGKNGKLLVK